MAKKSTLDRTVSPLIVGIVFTALVLMLGSVTWWMFIRDRSGTGNLTVEQKAEQIRKAREQEPNQNQGRHSL